MELSARIRGDDSQWWALIDISEPTLMSDIFHVLWFCWFCTIFRRSHCVFSFSFRGIMFLLLGFKNKEPKMCIYTKVQLSPEVVTCNMIWCMIASNIANKQQGEKERINVTSGNLSACLSGNHACNIHVLYENDCSPGKSPWGMLS